MYYFRRRIPDDVRKLYPGKKTRMLMFSLKTKDKNEAVRKANRHAIQQDALWKASRAGSLEYSPEQLKAAEELLRAHHLKPGDGNRKGLEIALEFFTDHLHETAMMYGEPSDEFEARQEQTPWEDYLPAVHRAAGDMLYAAKRPVFLSEAVSDFQSRRQEDTATTAGKYRIRVVNQFIQWFGDRPIDQYSRQDANEFINRLHGKGNKSGTIRRRLNSIRPVFRDAAREGEFEDRKIFEGLLIPEQKVDTKERLPFTEEEIALIQAECRVKNDDLRWIIALMSDTGMRLAEVVGLKVDDVVLDQPIPFVRIRPNHTRSLKTKGSERDMPLVGVSLRGASKAAESARGEFLFPRYIDSRSSPPQHKATHASNSLVKWIKSLDIEDKENKVAHSFRHSLKDRLRAVETPTDISNAIGGWKNRGVGEGYGKGYPLEVLSKYMNMIVIGEER